VCGSARVLRDEENDAGSEDAVALGIAVTLLLPVAPVALAGGGACPSPRVAQLERTFDRLDQDGDGLLGPDEVGPAARALFARRRTAPVAVRRPELLAVACRGGAVRLPERALGPRHRPHRNT
jgi:hypothetical protein